MCARFAAEIDSTPKVGVWFVCCTSLYTLIYGPRYITRTEKGLLAVFIKKIHASNYLVCCVNCRECLQIQGTK